MQINVREAMAAGASSDDIEQALEAQSEQAWLERVHPDASERILHRIGECDGSCSQICA